MIVMVNVVMMVELMVVHDGMRVGQVVARRNGSDGGLIGFIINGISMCVNGPMMPILISIIIKGVSVLINGPMMGQVMGMMVMMRLIQMVSCRVHPRVCRDALGQGLLQSLRDHLGKLILVKQTSIVGGVHLVVHHVRRDAVHRLRIV